MIFVARTLTPSNRRLRLSDNLSQGETHAVEWLHLAVPWSAWRSPRAWASPDPRPGRRAKYKEAPSLADQVKAGKLPPVSQRLPENPLVVPVVDKVGEYGGVWRRAFLGPADANNYVRVVYDALFRFSPDGAKIEPKIAESARALGRLQGLDDQAAQGLEAGPTASRSAPTTSCSGTTTCC